MAKSARKKKGKKAKTKKKAKKYAVKKKKLMRKAKTAPKKKSKKAKKAKPAKKAAPKKAAAPKESPVRRKKPLRRSPGGYAATPEARAGRTLPRRSLRRLRHRSLRLPPSRYPSCAGLHRRPRPRLGAHRGTRRIHLPPYSPLPGDGDSDENKT